MRKLDKLGDADLLGAFLAEKAGPRAATPQPPAPTRLPERAPAQAAEPPAPSAEAMALRAQVQALEAALGAAQAAGAAHAAARTAAETGLALAVAERRTAEQRLQLAEKRAALAEERLRAADRRALWSARGLTEGEIERAFSQLAAAFPAALWRAAMSAEPEPLRQFLNDRLALVCETCSPAAEALAFRLPPGRCELCGGSDLRAEFRSCCAAIAAAGHDRVTVVGGSPAYRETLRNLHRALSPPFALDVIASKRPGEAKRAQAASGLVVIWGGSEVDHDTTNHYRQRGERVLTVDHRGLSGFLPRLVALLARSN